MGDVAEVLAAARQAHAERAWQRAFELFSEARGTAALSPEDLGALSDAAWWLGRIGDFLDAGEAAFRGLLDAGRSQDAAMTALDIAVSLFLRGDDARGSGWIGRVQRLLEDLPEAPVHGYVRYVLEVERGLGGEDLDAVVASARDVQRIASLWSPAARRTVRSRTSWC